MKTVLITGGTGFVGSNLARRCLKEGHRVHLLLRDGYQSWRIQEIEKEVRTHIQILTNTDSISKLLRHVAPDWIFHLATEGAYPWQNDTAGIISTNLNGTISLLDAAIAQGFECFVNTGSSSEYGFKDHAPSENEIIEPNSEYAIAKAAATHYCEMSAKRDTLPIATLRLYSVYGPWEDPRRLIPSLIEAGLQKIFPPLVDPDISRDFVFVDDVVDAYLQLAEQFSSGSYLGRDNQIYNVGSGNQLSLGKIVSLCQQEFAIQDEPTWGTMPNRKWDSAIWCSDPKKIQTAIGWSARTTFVEGFKKTIEWQVRS
tara:strand:- start:502 stop:1440 length:939 start_codon:yes stop_codon:yes gene_type:complete